MYTTVAKSMLVGCGGCNRYIVSTPDIDPRNSCRLLYDAKTLTRTRRHTCSYQPPADGMSGVSVVSIPPVPCALPPCGCNGPVCATVSRTVYVLSADGNWLKR